MAGDFNSDFERKNKFDLILKNYMKDHEFFILDNPNSENSFTFKSSLINNNYYTSNIDHFIFCGPSIPTFFKDPKFKIYDDLANMSDHNAISFSFKFSYTHIESSKARVAPKNNLNLDNDKVKKFFYSEVDSRINYAFESIINSNFQITVYNKEQMNELYNNLCKVYTDSYEESLKFQNLSQCNSGEKNSNVEMSKDMKSCKKSLLKTYGKLKANPTNENKKEYKISQKSFKSCQRRERYLKELSEVSKLEYVSHLKNKNTFWKYTKKLKNKRSVIKEVTASSSKLFDHYKSFFTDDKSDLTLSQQNITSQVNDYFASYSKPQNFPFFTPDNLSRALIEVKNSKVKGFDLISYEIIKGSLSSTTHSCMLFFFNTMLFSAQIPNKLNVSIIKPILKDPNKNTEDLNNIRPISISTCFAQILEKLILNLSPGLKISHVNQFGFKEKTSCNHALFTLKETILNYTENQTGIKIASLDAEKAFDKVWRDAIFYKIIKKMDHTLWYILKIYYDSSQGTIDLGNGILSELFPITVGVKQVGILSPDLFKNMIYELIFTLVNKDIGARINNINVSTLVYADDIVLLSPVDSHLQRLLDICNEFSKTWRIKFNAKKSNVMEIGPQFFKLSFNDHAIEKFVEVQKSVFSLSFLGLQPGALSPQLQSFIYKTYCLSQFTYGLETSVLNKDTRDYLNICQNNLLRQILGLHKYCHMSNILKCLRLYSFEDLYISSKLSFLNSIKQNKITSNIFSYLCNTKRNRLSKSFIQDIKVLEKRFCLGIEAIYLECVSLKMILKRSFGLRNGIFDSINTCFSKYKSSTYKSLLDNLIKPDFIREDEAFQELLQYLIITGDYT
jgi:hypothetical protein